LAPLNEEQLVKIRDERKDQIMAAALKVFSRRGVVGTKMSMIKEEAGISHGLLYHYFKSKDELFVTLIQSALDGAQQAMVDMKRQPGSPLEKFRALAVEMLDVGGAPYFQLMHQARTSDGVPEQAKQLIAKYSMDDYIDYLTPLLTEGQKAGEIVPGDPKKLISCFLTVFTGVMMLGSQENGVYPIPDVDMLMRIITK
jgi:AcrR family transcriptional regulator